MRPAVVFVSLEDGRKRIRVLFCGGLSHEAVRIGRTLTAYLHDGAAERGTPAAGVDCWNGTEAVRRERPVFSGRKKEKAGLGERRKRN